MREGGKLLWQKGRRRKNFCRRCLDVPEWMAEEAMTEAEWQTCTEPQRMLSFLWEQEPLWPLRLLWLFSRRRWHPLPSARTLRLFMCACVRHVWDSLGDGRSERAVVVAERYADGLVSREELATAHHEAGRVIEEKAAPEGDVMIFDARIMAIMAAGSDLGAGFAYYRPFLDLFPPATDFRPVGQAALIRHIFGNPFTPYPPPPAWPAVVVELATSLYAGEDCAPMLADAVEEAGHAPLAEHFRSERGHPKGCWAIDLILGKK
jgi:hypothetical protein